MTHTRPTRGGEHGTSIKSGRRTCHMTHPPGPPSIGPAGQSAAPSRSGRQGCRSRSSTWWPCTCVHHHAQAGRGAGVGAVRGGPARVVLWVFRFLGLFRAWGLKLWEQWSTRWPCLCTCVCMCACVCTCACVWCVVCGANTPSASHTCMCGVWCKHPFCSRPQTAWQGSVHPDHPGQVSNPVYGLWKGKSWFQIRYMDCRGMPWDALLNIF